MFLETYDSNINNVNSINCKYNIKIKVQVDLGKLK